MNTVRRGKRQVKGEEPKRVTLADFALHAPVDTLVELIQALIPLGLMAVGDCLKADVARLAGARYRRGDGLAGHVRWGRQRGSVYLADQKLPIQVPRVRNRLTGQEAPLETYTRLQRPRGADAGLFRRVLKGLSCRDYEGCAEAVPEAFGLSPSTVSRRFIRASARKLKELCERPLQGYDFVGLVLDGKRFEDDLMVIALGITVQGEKVVLGFVQTGTENERALTAFLRELVERGLRSEAGLLCVIDGSKGLRAAIRRVFEAHAVVQRCQWHKREGVLSHLPKGRQGRIGRKLQAAYDEPTYEGAKGALGRLRKELELAQPLGGEEPGRRPGGDLDAPSPGGLSHLGEKPEDDELLGVDHVAHCSANGQGGPLAQQRPEAALGGHGAPRHRASAEPDPGLPASAGLEGRHPLYARPSG